MVQSIRLDNVVGVEFIDENGGGSGVRLRKPQRSKQSKGGFKFERKHHLTTLERMVRWQEIAYD
jgi:hypothetical protein